MSYELEFLPSALKEWQKLDNSIKVQFKKKLSDVGYCLAYQVKDSEIVVLVLVVGKRENNEVYEMLKDRA